MRSVTHLDRHHGEGEDVRSLAIFPFVPNLRRDPRQREAILTRCTLYGVRVSRDLSEAEIGDAYMAGVFHQDIGLAGCQYGVKKDPEQSRTPLRSPCITL